MIQGLDRFSPKNSDIAWASKLVPSVMLKNPEALSSYRLRRIAGAFPDLPSTRGLEYERWWVKWHEDKRCWANNIKFCRFSKLRRQLAIRPSTTASNERSFSNILNNLRFTMTADRLNGLSIMNVNQDIETPAETIIDNFGRLGPYRLAFL